MAAFLINHLDEPGAASRSSVAPAVATSSFDQSWDHAAKTVVDEVMEAGFEPPSWYTEVPATNEQVSDPEGLAALAGAAGSTEVDVTVVQVPTGVDDAEAMVALRWGTAHLAPHVATLDRPSRELLRIRGADAGAQRALTRPGGFADPCNAARLRRALLW